MNFLRNFQTWKINSIADAVYYVFFLFLGLYIFFLITKRLKKRRTRAFSLFKIEKKLRKLSRNKGIFAKVHVEAAPEDHLGWDAVFAVENTLIIIKIFWWGLLASGSAEGKTWKISDTKEEKTVKNPLLTLLPKCKSAAGFLAERKYSGPVLPLVIFSDNYGQPQLNLGSDSHTIIYKNLKKWYKEHLQNTNHSADPKEIVNVLRDFLSLV